MINYHLEDFTLRHYKEIIELAKTKFQFRSFINFQSADSPVVLWRHDLDLSVESALKTAEIETNSGVQATYFLLLHSPFYNLLDKANFLNIKKIIETGHQIGLHFDSHFYDVKDEKELEKHLLLEKKILESLFGTEINVFSFHLTNEFTMSCDRDQYAGMINTYSSYLKQNASYCSDSYGLWRFSRLYDFLKTINTNLCHVLTHPEWWVFNDLKPSGRIQKHIDVLSDKLKKDAEKNYTYNQRLSS